jgi:hypothetical protein
VPRKSGRLGGVAGSVVEYVSLITWGFLKASSRFASLLNYY